MSKKILLFLCACFFCISLEAQEGPNAITAQSKIDWNTQLINSIISLDTQKKGLQLPTGRNAALQMLEMETPSLLKDTFFSIIVDSSEKLGTSVAAGQISLSELNRIIDKGKRTPPYFSQDMVTISLSHTISLAQIGSLFIKHTSSYEPKIPLSTVPSRIYSGILIDVRGELDVHGEYTRSPMIPCLFPRIWSTDMDLLYEKNMVSPSIALKNGIIFYSSSTDESEYRERIGTDPLRITAREIYGMNRTDPVISTKDYLKILSIPENRLLLREGKVVFICNPDQLNPKSIAPIKDDDYYFTWQDIKTTLEKKAIPRVDFSSSWEGLKMTIYDIRFIADSADIMNEEKIRLDGIADALKLAGSDSRFTIEGHTANIGKPSGELALSIQRAKRIADEMGKRGIDSTRIDFTGYGGKRPIAQNDTDEGRAKNRRVEITIHLH